MLLFGLAESSKLVGASLCVDTPRHSQRARAGIHWGQGRREYQEVNRAEGLPAPQKLKTFESAAHRAAVSVPYAKLS